MTDKEISALNIKSACYYGKQFQMNHFTEEVAELIQAVIERNPEHIAEEIADVEVMVEQMQVLLDLDPEEVAKGTVEGQYTMHNQCGDENSCIWSLAGAIKALNKMRRTLRYTTLNDNIGRADAKIQQATAKKDFEYRVGDAVSCLNWLADKYSIAAGEIREIKSYKVQRTRDRIAQEQGE